MAADLAEWRRGLQDVRGTWDALMDFYHGELPADALSTVFHGASGWSIEQRVFALGQLDAGVSIEACRAGVAQWWEALAGATYFGRLDALRQLHAAMEEDSGKSGQKPDWSSTLTWGCWNYSIITGIPPAMNADVANQLFEWGAKPDFADHNSGAYFEKALRTSNAGVIRAFLEHGAPPELASKVCRELLAANDHKQASQIQDAFDRGGFYTKVDSLTLMETKYVSEPGGDSVLRTIFNFGARRVNEVFEFARGGGAMTSCGFDDYDRAALYAAQEKLTKLGGSPDAAPSALDKPKKRQQGLLTLSA